MEFRRLMAILLIVSPGLAACRAGNPGAARSDPLPPPPVWFKPARFMHVTWCKHDWELFSGRMGLTILGEEEAPRLPLGPESHGWYTFSCDGSPRFLFHVEAERIVLFKSVGASFGRFARIPLPLLPGKTWICGSAGGCGVLPEIADCREDGALLRVDFSRAEKILHSMWFDRTEGLVRWEGIEWSSIVRLPGDMADVQLRREALSYPRYRRLDDEDRFAPYDCKAPPLPALRRSVSRDESTHGRKLYYLFAKDRLAYLHAKDIDQPDGQVVAKESWIPGSPRTKGPLFLMVKSEGEWIYATATPDGKEITSSGKLASCRDCHESERTRDRMFGLASCAAAK